MFVFVGGGGAFDLFDSESGQDLTLSPQTFTSSTEAFLNDNSESLPGAPGDADTGRNNSQHCNTMCNSREQSCDRAVEISNLLS
ncbi:hypothetical protein B566_EDAN001136 [Ephemera danica]|nr:hypothetical protein B566_EDAN001136 [Ephemera danica]